MMKKQSSGKTTLYSFCAFLVMTCLIVGSSLGLAVTNVDAIDSYTPPGWKKKETGLWQNSKSSDEALVYKKLAGAWFDINKAGPASYRSKLESVRQSMESFLGVSHWRVEKFHFGRNKAGFDVFAFTATYQFANQQHYLLEFQEFRSPHIFQVQFKSSKGMDLNDSKARAILADLERYFQ